MGVARTWPTEATRHRNAFPPFSRGFQERKRESVCVCEREIVKERARERLCACEHTHTLEKDSVIKKETHTCKERVRECLCDRDSE